MALSIALLLLLTLAEPIAAAPPQISPGGVPTPRLNAPGPNDVYVMAVQQESEGSMRRLKGLAQIETSDILLRADYIEYDELTGDAIAEGNVKFRNYVSGEVLEARRVEYNIVEATGKFYEVKGQVSGKVDPRPGLLISGNPFVFQGSWAEKLKDRYLLYDGVLTNCKLPKPVWTLKGPKFDIKPGDRALVYKARFRVRNVPLLYAPVFYKSLQERPRKSGFLTPNIGNSSRRGFMLGAGYYWAINRSYDAAYRAQYFSQRGFAHHVNARGKPTQRSTFDVYFYGVNDRGKELGGGRKIDASGFLLSVTGDADLGKGFKSRWDVNYLSSFLFREEFTESFNEAVRSEVHSVAYITRNWSNYGFDAVFRRSENFPTRNDDDKITIRKLPQFRFTVRDREVSRKVLPVSVSLDSQFGLLSRDQLLFQTRRWVERVDIAPRVSTALRLKGISIIPAVSVRGTHWDSSWQDGQISGNGVLRTSGEFSTEFRLPSIGRIYQGPRWIGEKVKHVVEARAGYRYVGGIDDFHRYILFDDTETYSNTSELDYSLTNRVYAKRNGVVHEVLSWELWQARFFNEDFSGAVIDGKRNVLASSQRLTGYAFLDGARAWSPIVSNLRMSPKPGWGISWRTDYDTLFNRFSNNGITADARFGSKYFVSVGANRVNTNPVLTPPANQIRGLVVLGDPNKRGWNGAFNAVYDWRRDIVQYATTQLTYNTGCCGISFQYRRFNFGTRQGENQYRVAFAISNIGSFGTLKKQERLF